MVISHSWILIGGKSLLQIKFEVANAKTDRLEFSFTSLDHNLLNQKEQQGESLPSA